MVGRHRAPDDGMPPNPQDQSETVVPDQGRHVSHETIDSITSRIAISDRLKSPVARELMNEKKRWKQLAKQPVPRPDHTRVLTISNQKGGVGKTSTAVNLAAAMADRGFETLVVDIDPQGNASTALNIEHGMDVDSTYDVLIEGTPVKDVVRQCPDYPNLYCIPSNIDLALSLIHI